MNQTKIIKYFVSLHSSLSYYSNIFLYSFDNMLMPYMSVSALEINEFNEMNEVSIRKFFYFKNFRLHSFYGVIH